MRSLAFVVSSVVVLAFGLLPSPLGASPFAVQAEWPVGVGPNAMAVACGGRILVVCNSDTGDVSRIDLARAQVLSPVAVGRVPLAIALSEDGAVAYVACFYGKSVAFVDVAEGRLIRSVDVAVHPRGLVRLGDRLVVSGYYEGEAVAVDTGSGAVTGRLAIAVGLSPVVAHPDGARAYILNTSRDALYEVRVRPLRVTASLGEELDYGGAWDLKITRDGSTLVISQWNGDRVAVVRTSPLSVVGFCATGGHGPCALDLSPDGRLAVVAMSEADTAAVIDIPNLSLRGVLPVGRFPFSDVLVTDDGKWAFVTADNDGSVAVIDLDRIETVDHLATGRIPHAFCAGPARRWFVANTGEGTVAVIGDGGARRLHFRRLHR